MCLKEYEKADIEKLSYLLCNYSACRHQDAIYESIIQTNVKLWVTFFVFYNYLDTNSYYLEFTIFLIFCSLLNI